MHRISVSVCSGEGKVLCEERCHGREGRSSQVSYLPSLPLAWPLPLPSGGWDGRGKEEIDREREMGGPSVRSERGPGALDEITGEEGWKEGGREGGSWSGGVFPFHVSFFLLPATTLQSGRSLAGPPAIEDARRPTRLAGGRASRSGTHSHAARERGGTVAKALSASLSLSLLFLFSELV